MRIQIKPIPHYFASLKLTQLVVGEVDHLLQRTWSLGLCSEPGREGNMIAVREEWAMETDKELTADTTVSLKRLGSYRSEV